MLLHVCVHNQIRFTYVLSDSWYAAADNFQYIKQVLKKEFVMPLKSNRKVALSEAEKKHGHYQAVSTLDLPEGTTRPAWLEGVDFPLLLAKQVFTNKDGAVGTLYLVTSDVTLTYDRLTKLYQKRSSIEVFHKSLKQNAALEKSPTRTPTTQRNHFFASLCAYIKLERLRLGSGLNHFALKSKIYFSALQSAYVELVKLKDQLLTA